MSYSNMFFLIPLCLAVAVSSGCGSDEEEVSAADDACEHMAEGPNQAVTALMDSSGDAPDVGAEHTRFDITLAGDGSNRVGFVDLVVEEASERGLFMNAQVPVKVRDSGGTEVAVEMTLSAVSECAEVAVGHIFDFEVGTYSIEFGPTDQATLQLVVAEEGHGHE